MKNYKDATPTTASGDLDVLRSGYTNLVLAKTKGKTFTVSQAYIANLPGIADRAYGNQKYWRALMWANGIQDPLNHVVLGMKLRIPPVEFLDEHMLKKHRKSGMQ
jgi:hypothetical protein